MKLSINSAKQMQNLGKVIAQTASEHDLLLLNGDLGAGKTTLTQGLGRALGIRRPVKSPTFTIVREYREGKMPLFHMDFYRLEDDDLSSIDLNEYLSEPGLVVIEWPDIIAENLPDAYLELKITRVDDSWNSTKREIELKPKGANYQTWAEKIIDNFEA